MFTDNCEKSNVYATHWVRFSQVYFLDNVRHYKHRKTQNAPVINW